MAYSEKVLEHYENPRNVGTFEKDEENVGTGMVGAPACFDGNTRIALPSDTGYATLRSIFDNNIPIHVWSLNANTKKFELKLARCVKTGIKEVVQLNMDDGGLIVSTPDHLFLTAVGKYAPCGTSKGVSLKSFNKIIDNNGYWQINRKNYEHIDFIKEVQSILQSFMWTHNVDHINEIKTDNRLENLQLLSISDHNYKSKDKRKTKTIAEQVSDICTNISSEEVHNMTVIEQLPRWQIGNKLGITVDWVAEIQRHFGLTANPRRLLPEEERIASRQRKLREKNPHFSGFSDDDLLQIGNSLYVQHGTLTNKIWKDYTKGTKIPCKVEHRFGKFSNFVDQSVAFNHKIIDVINLDNSQEVYCLQVEENNNFVVLTSTTLNRHSGVVVHNCGDVMRLQIKVNPDSGLIEDAKFKTYGCGSAIASSSLVTEWVKGKSLDQALEIKNTNIAEELSLPPVKIHCSILAEDAIKAAIEDYKKNH